MSPTNLDLLTPIPLSIIQREAVSLTDENRLIVDEEALDLFNYYEKKIPYWEPTNKIKPFKELQRLYIDIETTGLDPEIDSIVLIGVMNQEGKHKIYHSQKERVMISDFLNDLPNWEPDILTLFNGFSFDLPFIIRRAAINNISTKYVFSVSKYVTTFRTAQKWGKPTQYNAIFYNGIRGKHVAIIDLYHQVLAWDYVKRIMTEYNLKQSVKQIPSLVDPLRKEDRTELDYQMILKCIQAWSIPKQKEPHLGKTGEELLREYLVYDLEDTKLLGEYLLPSIYYQKLILPADQWKLQAISTSGNGKKWNSILEEEYKNVITESDDSYIDTVEPSPKLRYDGGYTYARAGLYRNVSKIDVASLYPSVMLIYGIYTSKDIFGKMLAILYWLTKERLRLKKIGKDKTGKYTKEEISDAKQMEASMKVMINSLYGLLGTMGVKFNDYFAAALVTAYGRKILKLMMETIEKHGGICASCDTDGVYYSTNDDTFEKNKFIHQKVQEAMPEGINIDYEGDIEALAFYVPAIDNKKFSKKKLKEMGIEEGQYLDEGLRKNYIMMLRDGKTKANGKYRKRDRCRLEKEFTPQLLQWYMKSPMQATKFYLVVKNQIENMTMPIELLTINRKIKKSEKTVVELGLGKPEEAITFYEAYQEVLIDPNKKIRRNAKPKPTNVKKLSKHYDMDYDVKFYLDIITQQYREFMAMAKKIEIVTSLNSLVTNEEIDTDIVTL